MLSILIPIYNYNAYPLVEELHKQCMESNVDFEILCQDDSSSEFLLENQKINSLDYGQFLSNEYNQGRGKNINTLNERAQFDYLLILDCDTYPKDKHFIKNYLAIIKEENPAVVYGGLLYKNQKPKNQKLLRWVYGNKREAISLEKRNKNPNKTALTSNLLVRNNVFTKYPFDTSITKYGYEDLCFLAVLEENKIIVKHLKNPTYHLNLETSLQFLNKTKVAIENLVFLVNSKKISKHNSLLFSTYETLRRFKLVTLTVFLFRKSERKIVSNLLSEKPSILLFDLFKLGYFCQLKINR